MKFIPLIYQPFYKNIIEKGCDNDDVGGGDEHKRLMQTILDALQSSGDDSLELPDGITLNAETLQELFNVEKVLENGENYQKMYKTAV